MVGSSPVLPAQEVEIRLLASVTEWPPQRRNYLRLRRSGPHSIDPPVEV